MHTRTPSLFLAPALVALVALASACASRATTGSELAELYAAQIADESHADYSAIDAHEQLARSAKTLERRVARVRELVSDGLPATAEECRYAARILVASTEKDPEDLARDLGLARDLALSAAERGDRRGLSTAAEAIDKLLILRDLPQRFATQYVWEPVPGRWILWTVDATVTDEDRRAMGVPTLAAAVARLAELNRPEVLEAMRSGR